ncbi:MAG TPA: FAD-dependent monooxygenase [Actinomycetes bacterium]|nr:FAD-dependent monooxygenase [Actinomycetes bacterium]
MRPTTHPPGASRHDVIVVGARPAGAATALLLARSGLRVLVVDRARHGSDTVSTHALMRGGVLQLTRWGLLDGLGRAGTPPVTRVVFHYPDDSVRVSIRPAAGVRALYAPRRTLLDAMLADAAAEAGAEVRFQVAVTGLLTGRDGRVTGIAGRDRTGRRVTAHAPLVVGADGIRSTVARAVGAPVVRAGGGASAFLYGYWTGLGTEGYEWFYAPGVSAGMVPTNGGQVCVFAGTTPARMRAARTAGPHAAHHALLAAVSPEAAGRVAAAVPPRRLRGFGGLPGYVRRSFGPGWALVGDAGCFEDPLATHGITDALRDAELLARAVGEIHGGTATEAAALAAYQRTRDRLGGPLFTTVDRIASYRWDTDQLRRLLLQLSSAMSDQVEALGRLDLPDELDDHLVLPAG